MAKLKMTAAVTSQVQLAEGIYDLRLAAGEIAAQAVPGQLYPFILKTDPDCFQDLSVFVVLIKKRASCAWYTV